MVRCSVTVCDAAPEDSTALVAVWATAADRAGNVPDAAAHAAQ